MNRQVAEEDLIRARLRAEGYHFCDEAVVPAHGEQNLNSLVVAQLRHEDDEGHADIIEAGVSSSTCDHPSQAIGNTLRNDEEFWSSTGSENSGGETLLYRLRHPLCRVLTVQLEIYRARYQFGSPVYPPRAVSFAIGLSPRQLQKVPGVYPVKPHDKPQLFPLPAEAPVGRYLQVILHGKQQRQLQDLDFYIALRRVWAVGWVVPFLQLRSIARLPSRKCLSLQNGFCLPGNSEHLIQKDSRNEQALPGGEVSINRDGDRRLMLQGLGLVARVVPSQHREMPMFTWHDVPESDADSMDLDGRG